MVQVQSSPPDYIWSYGHLLERYHSGHLHLNSFHIGLTSLRNSGSLHLARTSFNMVTFMIANILHTSRETARARARAVFHRRHNTEY